MRNSRMKSGNSRRKSDNSRKTKKIEPLSKERLDFFHFI